MAYAREEANSLNFSLFSDGMDSTPTRKTADFEDELVQTESPKTPTTPALPMPADDDAAGLWGLPECAEDAEIEALLEPVLREILCRSKGKNFSGDCNAVRWWNRPQSPMLCPLTRFPICLLPYPPFKLRVDPKHSSPHRLIDGKFLAMQCIVTGRFAACGRELIASDISALDDYIHRCKLGQYRPGRAAALAKEANKAPSPEQRAKASQDLESFVASARAELGKLRRIQENRLLQINKVLPAHAQAALKITLPSLEKSPKASSCRSRASTSGSMSTRASVSSGDSDISL